LFKKQCKKGSYIFMKNLRKGQAAIWSVNVIRKLRSRLIIPAHRLIFEISLFTGERMGAIVQLKVSDVYDSKGKVLKYITFASNTRKASKHGYAQTRQVAIHLDLAVFFRQYTPPPYGGYLFPTNSSYGHITRRAVDYYWRKHLSDLGFTGFSTHSSRRWVINQLRATGIEIVTIAEAMGMDIATVRHYLDNDPVACHRAIASLTV
jgi:integrase/recombinase XerD